MDGKVQGGVRGLGRGEGLPVKRLESGVKAVCECVRRNMCACGFLGGWGYGLEGLRLGLGGEGLCEGLGVQCA